MTAPAPLSERSVASFAQIQDRDTESVARAIMARNNEARTSLRVRDIEAALEAGDDAFLVAPMEAAMLGVTVLTAATFRRAALEANTLAPLYVFDDSAPGVAIAMRESRDRVRRELVGGIGEQLRELRRIGNDRGLRERQLARELRDSIGLNAAGMRQVENFRQVLIAGDEATIRDLRSGQTALGRLEVGDLSATQRNRVVDRFRRQLIAQRAELIARLEVQRQIGAGLNEYLEQALEAGQLRRDEVEQVWRTRGRNVRPSHAAMSGQTREIGEPFDSGAGNLLRFPGDPAAPISETARCKCAVRVIRRRS